MRWMTWRAIFAGPDPGRHDVIHHGRSVRAGSRSRGGERGHGVQVVRGAAGQGLADITCHAIDTQHTPAFIDLKGIL